MRDYEDDQGRTTSKEAIKKEDEAYDSDVKAQFHPFSLNSKIVKYHPLTVRFKATPFSKRGSFAEEVALKLQPSDCGCQIQTREC